MYAIEARGVTRRYGEVQALTGVDLDVKVGEVFAVLGPNGAGKTTLVEILEGLRRRDGGSASVLGADPAWAARAWRSRIGAVLQVSTQNDELTVDEMVRAYAGYYPHPLESGHLLEALDLTAIRDRRIHQLSGGQRRRLDLALGLVGDPDLLFLDEPTTGLDPEVRIRIWEFIEGLSEQGTTILLTTHYMEEAERLCDELVIMDHGRILAQGSPRDLIGQHVETDVIEVRGQGDTLHELARQSGCRLEQMGNSLYCYTQNPAPLIEQLKDRHTVRFVHRPTGLEDVFLRLTGRELRD